MAKQIQGTLSAASDNMAEIRGSIERIVFHNEENGYTIFRLRPENKLDFETLVGVMQNPQAGTQIRAKGRYTVHPKFGRQFQMESYAEERPSSAEGIRAFLASGCIKGIGPKWAEKIVSHFGTETFNILDNAPDRLLDIPRFGQKRLTAVKLSWAEHQGVRELMIFLQEHGIGPSFAFRIYKHYEKQAINIVKENPYRLAMDIFGIGFHTADMLAMKLGFEKNSLLRAEAGLLYTLLEISGEGHIYYPQDKLIEKTSADLDIEEGLVAKAIDNLHREERIVIDDLEDHKGVYLTRHYHYESKIAFYLKRLLHSPRTVRFKDAEASIAAVLAKMKIELAEEQLLAVNTAAKEKIMVLTGGPGTGKTTILNAIIKVFQSVGAKVLLAAPTGRAAKRMSETSGVEAKTIHRLLEFSPKEEGFGRNENNPLACGLLVVDEASMMDTMLMYHLIKAAPMGATLIFVGDVNQLPSVGPGNVLRDIIASGTVPVVELVEVFRQAAESDIICNAHLINKGEMPHLRSGLKTDFFMFKQEDGAECASLIVDLVKNRIPKKFGFSPEDIQVLCPMTKGSTGTLNLNKELQQALNPNTEQIVRGDKIFRLHDKVMQIRNNYDKDVFNGDMGHIIVIDREERELTIRFDERNIVYAFEELDEVVPAYAITIHKSQGAEYPVVIVPLLMQHFVMLERNLIYTAVTRGKKMVVLAGQMKALAMGVKNNKIRRRYTWLAKRLALDENSLREDMLPFALEKKDGGTAAAKGKRADIGDDMPDYGDEPDFFDDMDFLQPIDEDVTYYGDID